MSAREIYISESDPDRRRVYFDLRDATDGLTPEEGEAGSQPQLSLNGAAWTNTGIGTLSHIGNGRYYAELTGTYVDARADGDVIETRYKSAATAETPGDQIAFRYKLLTEGSVNDTTPLVGDFDTTLTAGDNDGQFLIFIEGANKGYTRKISAHTVTTGNMAFTGSAGSMAAPWPATPADGDKFIIIGIGA